MQIKWNNITYPDAQTLAKAKGVCKTTVYNWVRFGYTSDDDVVRRGEDNRKPVEWNGVQYASIHEAAVANYVNDNTMSYRIRQGYTRDEDLAW